MQAFVFTAMFSAALGLIPFVFGVKNAILSKSLMPSKREDGSLWVPVLVQNSYEEDGVEALERYGILRVFPEVIMFHDMGRKISEIFPKIPSELPEATPLIEGNIFPPCHANSVFFVKGYSPREALRLLNEMLSDDVKDMLSIPNGYTSFYNTQYKTHPIIVDAIILQAVQARPELKDTVKALGGMRYYALAGHDVETVTHLLEKGIKAILDGIAIELGTDSRLLQNLIDDGVPMPQLANAASILAQALVSQVDDVNLETRSCAAAVLAALFHDKDDALMALRDGWRALNPTAEQVHEIAQIFNSGLLREYRLSNKVAFFQAFDIHTRVAIAERIGVEGLTRAFVRMEILRKTVGRHLITTRTEFLDVFGMETEDLMPRNLMGYNEISLDSAKA
jgi:hypothetical protein